MPLVEMWSNEEAMIGQQATIRRPTADGAMGLLASRGRAQVGN